MCIMVIGGEVIKYSVLIVEDNIQWADNLRREMEQYPYFNLAPLISNGRDAIVFIEVNRPDIIVLDLIIPIYDGVYVASYINEHIPDYNPFIYALSVINADQTNIILRNLNIAYFSLKPIEPQVIINNLTRLLIGTNRIHAPIILPDKKTGMPEKTCAIDLDRIIKNYLFSLGLPINRISTTTLLLALKISVLDESKLGSTVRLYSIVAESLQPTLSTSSVERNIRSAVKKVQAVSTETYHKYFPVCGKQMTNTVFLCDSVHILKGIIEEELNGSLFIPENDQLHS